MKRLLTALAVLALPIEMRSPAVALESTAPTIEGAPYAIQPPTHPVLRSANLPELIPAAQFFAPREPRFAYQVSPDGTRLAWVGASDLWTTVFYRKIGGGEVHKVETRKPTAGSQTAADRA